MDRIKTTANIGLAKAGLMEVIEHSYFYQHLCLNQADVFQIPHLRQAENRWWQSQKNHNF
ncbi:MAG: hypothetical protein U0X91_01890 [Spirosomataceae bacterium]